MRGSAGHLPVFLRGGLPLCCRRGRPGGGSLTAGGGRGHLHNKQAWVHGPAQGCSTRYGLHCRMCGCCLARAWNVALNSASSTGLDLARSAGHHKVVAALLAEPGATKLVTMQIRLGGSTALHLAAEKSHFNVVQEILQVCSSPGCWLPMPFCSLAPCRACAALRMRRLAHCLSASLPPPARPSSLSLAPSL